MEIFRMEIFRMEIFRMREEEKAKKAEDSRRP
jgi:hypothetical protein